jgi:glycosyltransferase involved in cell wall biosynthesis
MPALRAPEVLIVSVGSTEGLRRADSELEGSIGRSGSTVALVSAAPPAQRRTLMLTDYGWARAARAAAVGTLATFEDAPRAVVYSSTTAALMWPRPGAVRFDATAGANRPGRHGLWQRPLERRRLASASLLLPWSEGALNEANRDGIERDRALVLPVAVEPSGTSGNRDIAVLTYAANPEKKGLDRVLAAWRELRRDGRFAGEELHIAGVSTHGLERAGISIAPGDAVRVHGELVPDDYRALLRRARVFACAPRREDYGIAQLEALADGCLLVSAPSPGPYAALPIARRLDERLIGWDLASALAAALADPLPGYAQRAAEALAPFRRAAVDRLVAEQLLPRLLGEGA